MIPKYREGFFRDVFALVKDMLNDKWAGTPEEAYWLARREVETRDKAVELKGAK